MTHMTACKCQWCGSDFQARTADVKRGWGKFCSKSCKASEQEKRTKQNFKHSNSNKQTDHMQQWERDEQMHNDALYDAFQSHGQDGF